MFHGQTARQSSAWSSLPSKITRRAPFSPAAPKIRRARAAAEQLDIPLDVISIAPPEATHVAAGQGQIEPGESAVVFRGRAAQKLTARADKHSWDSFTCCPFAVVTVFCATLAVFGAWWLWPMWSSPLALWRLL